MLALVTSKNSYHNSPVHEHEVISIDQCELFCGKVQLFGGQMVEHAVVNASIAVQVPLELPWGR